MKDNITAGAASFSGSESRYKFDNTAAAADAAFATASNSTETAKIISGNLATVATSATWIHKVEVGTGHYASAATGSNAAYAVITGSLVISTAAGEHLGDYVVTVSKGSDYDDVADYFVILIEADWASDSFEVLDLGTNNVFTKADNTAAGTYTFKIVVWLDGTLAQANLPGSALADKQLLSISAAYNQGA